MSKLTRIASLALLCVSLSATGALAQSGISTASVTPRPERAHGHPGERHPALHRAIANLNRAKWALEHAKGAEDMPARKKALALVDQAIAELNAALKLNPKK